VTAFSLRRATVADVPEMAALFRRVQAATRPFKPHLHTPGEDREFQLGIVTDKKAWLAEEDGRVVGFIGYGFGWVDQLYVDLDHQRRGIGDALLNQVKSEAGRLQLWVFQENVGARRFYERRGFRLVRETDGAENEEREPDALLEWRA
jgi:GNAT superfamily N-acetyltransferase